MLPKTVVSKKKADLRKKFLWRETVQAMEKDYPEVETFTRMYLVLSMDAIHFA